MMEYESQLISRESTSFCKQESPQSIYHSVHATAIHNNPPLLTKKIQD